MEPITFGYSKFVGWSGILLLSTALIVLSYLLSYFIIPGDDIKIVLCFLILILLTLALIIYFLIWCFIPMIKGAITLELDEEKFQCYITRTTVYWKDVAEISIKYKRYEPFIIFEMVDGRNNLDVSISWIEGSSTSIYDKVQEYFARTL